MRRFIHCKDIGGEEGRGMRRRRWGRRAAGWALALLAAGAAGWVGLERLRPPLLIRVTAQEQREAVGHAVRAMYL